jgi:hypothetical protein
MTDFFNLAVTKGGKIKINPDCLMSDKLKVLCRYVEQGYMVVENYFKHPFIKTFDLRIFSNKKSLISYWESEWADFNLEPACWMVASGTEKVLAILSPEHWESETCEHNFSNESRTKRIIIHELVHVFHDQYNPKQQFVEMEPLTWFVEGVAVQVSGQENDIHRSSACEAVRLGKAPKSLDQAWTGKYRYSISGSLVGYIESIFGRQMIFELLECTDENSLLDRIGLSAQELLEEWEKFVIDKE